MGFGPKPQIPNPQSPIPNPQSPLTNKLKIKINFLIKKFFTIKFYIKKII
jgi:hypothetical protein